MRAVCFVVASRFNAKLLESTGPNQELKLIKELRSEDGRFHQFARSIAKTIDTEMARGTYGELVLVAEPDFLGIIRASLGRNALKSVVATVKKDFAKARGKVLRDRLAATVTEIWSHPKRWPVAFTSSLLSRPGLLA